MKEKVLVQLLNKNKLTIASAESCTGGMFASTIINVPGSSAVINSSIVTYSNNAKEKFCYVNQKTIEEFDVVSENVAIEMARGIQKNCEADIGVSFTGYAGPTGTETIPSGTVCMAIAYKENIFSFTKKIKGNRTKVRKKAVKFVIDELINILK